MHKYSYAGIIDNNDSITSICLSVGRIADNLPNQFPWNSVAGWSIGQKRIHESLEQIQVTGQLHKISFSFMAEVCIQQCFFILQSSRWPES